MTLSPGISRYSSALIVNISGTFGASARPLPPVKDVRKRQNRHQRRRGMTEFLDMKLPTLHTSDRRARRKRRYCAALSAVSMRIVGSELARDSEVRIACKQAPTSLTEKSMGLRGRSRPFCIITAQLK